MFLVRNYPNTINIRGAPAAEVGHRGNDFVMSLNQTPVLTTGDASGIVKLDFGSLGTRAPNVVLQADGKIIVNVYAAGPGSPSELIRYNGDGSFDTTFGADGIVSAAPNATTAAGVLIQPDGKIVVAGSGVLARYASDGSFDTSFGTGGTATTHFITTASSATLQADGKIVLIGGAADSFAVARYDASGNLDPSFGIGGKLTTSFGSSAIVDANSVVSQPDGKLVVAGTVDNAGQYDFAVARYNNDGSLDTTFGAGGRLVTDLASFEDRALSVAVQVDGKIIASGFTRDALSRENFALVRYNVDGSLDTSFGTGGEVVTDVASTFSERVESIQVQPDGKIIVAGFSFNGPGAQSDFALVRYNSDGSLDTSFGSGGKVLTNAGGIRDEVHSLVLRPDGDILVAGTTGTSTNLDLALAHYTSDGALDTSFGADTGAALSGPGFFTENAAPSILNARATIDDAELDAAGSYAGASLTLARHGGANAEDVFGASGNLATLTQGGDIVLSGVAIGTVTQNEEGTLVLTFGAAATAGRVNEAMRSITYANTSDTPALSVQIEWSFSDGNTGAQGSGGALAATGLTTVHVTPFNDAPVNTVPGPVSTVADTDVAITGLAVSDVDSASLTTVLRADHGTVKVAAVDGTTVVGSGTGLVMLTGSVAQINATLGAAHNVLYRSAAAFSGTDTLNMSTVDGGQDPFTAVFSDVAIDVTTVPGSVALNDVTITEGNSGTRVATFTVTRAAGTAPIDVDFATADGSATTADNDYVATSGTLHFAAGVKTQTISVTINGDGKPESDEAFSVNLSGATNGATISDGSATGIIADDDTAGSVAINDVTIAEGDGGGKVATFTVSRSGGTAPFAVDFATSDGSATVADYDYFANSGTLHFGSGVNTQTVSVTVAGDGKFEPDEAFTVSLSGATNGAAIGDGSGTATITNDDPEPAGAVAINDVTIAEGDGGTRVATFTVTRSGGGAPFAVDFATFDGSATVSDQDYAATSGTLSFGAGVDTQTISVTVNGDSKVESDETFFIILSNATNGATISNLWATGTITNDDVAGSVAINDVTIAEGASGSKVATFTVTRSGGTAAFTVNFATSDGSATISDHDYVANSGTLNFAGGVNAQTISVIVNGDRNSEGDEAFFVDLSGATGGGVISDSEGTGIIGNDEAFAQLMLKFAGFNPANGWTSEDRFPRELADVNGDGMADIVGFGIPGVKVALATGGGNFATPETRLAAFNPDNGWTSDDAFHREFADVNGDGMADIVGFGIPGVKVALATGGGNFATPEVKLAAFNPANGWTSQDAFHRELADVNGDHMADIVGFGNGGVYVSLATGGGNFATPEIKLAAFNPANGWTSQDAFHRELADVNGDGMADIVGFGNGGVYVSLATGGGNFAPFRIDIAAFNPANGWTSNDQFPRELADVNHDGMADIVGFGSGGVYVATATGDGHFAAPMVDIAAFNPANGWTSDNSFHRELADVNHDGFADIVGFGNPGVLEALSNGGFHLI
jgi:uncharacterized delta-60 repeat protein